MTKEKYTKSKITNFKTAKNHIKGFEKHRKRRIFLDGFSIEVYDEFIKYLRDIKQYSNHTSATTIRDLKRMLYVADQECKFQVHPDYLRKDFTRPNADSEAIALNEDEIDKIFTHDFSYDTELQNSRDFIIIGLWTGLRFSDFIKLPPIDITKRFITVKPNKTKGTTGVSVVIPIHYQVKAIIAKRGMPSPISKVQFNEDFKRVCQAVGLSEKVYGDLLVYIDKLKAHRKRSGMYEKYKLVSSHTCRRSFATNMYYSNFPILSIMKITGHSTQTSFLNYIKVTEEQHGQRLYDHWEAYYQERGKKQAA
ncbi:Integrase (fragment) [Tenacibaculum amylolyticum]